MYVRLYLSHNGSVVCGELGSALIVLVGCTFLHWVSDGRHPLVACCRVPRTASQAPAGI